MKRVILPAEISLVLQPSWILLVWLSVLLILVWISVMWLGLSWGNIWWQGALLCLLVTIWGARQILQHALLNLVTSWRAVKVDVYGQVYAQNKRLGWQAVQVLEKSVVHPWLLVLHFKAEEMNWLKRAWYELCGNHVLMILPDQADAEELRRLRVWLRWGLREFL